MTLNLDFKLDNTLHEYKFYVLNRKHTAQALSVHESDLP